MTKHRTQNETIVKLEMWQNSKTQNLAKLKNSKWGEKKIKYSKYDKTQKIKMWRKKSKWEKNQKIKMWQISKT